MRFQAKYCPEECKSYRNDQGARRTSSGRQVVGRDSALSVIHLSLPFAEPSLNSSAHMKQEKGNFIKYSSPNTIRAEAKSRPPSLDPARKQSQKKRRITCISYEWKMKRRQRWIQSKAVRKSLKITSDHSYRPLLGWTENSSGVLCQTKDRKVKMEWKSWKHSAF